MNYSVPGIVYYVEAVVFIGILGSGKSSFFKERFYDTHVRISRDLLKTAHREREFFETCLRTKQRFVIDKVNATAKERSDYVQRAKAAGYHVVGYYFQCTPQEAIARNNQRAGKARVPVPGILSAYKRMEPPTLSEGFDELYWVRLTPENRFEVAPATNIKNQPEQASKTRDPSVQTDPQPGS